MINGQIASFLQQVQPQPGIVPNYQLPPAPALLSAPPAAPGPAGGSGGGVPAAPSNTPGSGTQSGQGGSNPILQMIQKLLGGAGGASPGNGISMESGASIDPADIMVM